MNSKPFSAVLGLLLAAATIHGAHAQSAGAKVVTRDELRVCMNRESELGGQRQALELQNRRNGEEFAAVRAEGDELKAEQERLEREPNRTERFERRLRAYNAKVAAAKAKEASFRAGLDALNQAVADHNTRCGGISFLPEDKEAILKEREAAAK